MNMALDKAIAEDFTPLITPTLVRPEIMAGTGFLGEHADEIYYLPGRRPLPHRHQRGRARRLPRRRDPRRLERAAPLRRLVDLLPPRGRARRARTTAASCACTSSTSSRCSATCCPRTPRPSTSGSSSFQEQMLQACELSYRVIDVAAGDLGSSAARKFDIEAWVPTQGTYRELTSTSNCTTYQARRLDTRYRTESRARRPRSRPSTAPSPPPAGSSRFSRRTSRPTARWSCPRRCAPTSAASRSSSRSREHPRETSRSGAVRTRRHLAGRPRHRRHDPARGRLHQRCRPSARSGACATVGHEVMLATGPLGRHDAARARAARHHAEYVVCSNGAITLRPRRHRHHRLLARLRRDVRPERGADDHQRAALEDAHYAVEDEDGLCCYTGDFPEARLTDDQPRGRVRRAARRPATRVVVHLARATPRGLPRDRREHGPAQGLATTSAGPPGSTSPPTASTRRRRSSACARCSTSRATA